MLYKWINYIIVERINNIVRISAILSKLIPTKLNSITYT